MDDTESVMEESVDSVGQADTLGLDLVLGLVAQCSQTVSSPSVGTPLVDLPPASIV